MVLRGDQKTFGLKPFHWGSDVCTLRKSLGVFSVHATPVTPSLAARKSSLHPFLFPCPRTHAAPSLLPACTMSSSAASLVQGEAAGGETLWKSQRMLVHSFIQAARLPLALSHPSLAQSTNAFPATRIVLSALPRPVMPSTKVLSLGTSPFI